MRKKLIGWKEKLLSKARKEILIKAMAQAISTYTMGYFRLPNSLCGGINKHGSEFLVGPEIGRKKNGMVELGENVFPQS